MSNKINKNIWTEISCQTCSSTKNVYIKKHVGSYEIRTCKKCIKKRMKVIGGRYNVQ